MEEKIERLLKNFWNMGRGISQFINMPSSCDVSEVKYFDVYAGYIKRDLAESKLPSEDANKLKLCLMLGEEMGVLNDIYFYREKEPSIVFFEDLVKKAKTILEKEKKLGLDRDFYKRDYDLLPIMKKNSEYELMHDKILSMAKEISENYFHYLISAEEGIKK